MTRSFILTTVTPYILITVIIILLIIVIKYLKRVEKVVFIILRHVNSKLTNEYWKESYLCIRRLYPYIKIVIIDDNSDKKYLNNENIKLENVEIINSKYKKRGELLPYYYFYKNKFAEKAIIIHDSVFLQGKINFNDVKDIKFLWHHLHYFDNIVEEKEKISYLKDSEELNKLYDSKNKWLLSCGVMSVINYDFLKKIQEKYNFFNLLKVIKTRSDRMCLERIFGLVCHAVKPTLIFNPSFFGIQHEYKYNYYDYIKDKNEDSLNKEIVKVFTGR